MTKNEVFPRNGSPPGSMQAVILHKRNDSEGEVLLNLLETELTKNGVHVFLDRALIIGLDWAKTVEAQIRQADAVVVLLSEEGLQSELVSFQLETAFEISEANAGRPVLIGVRMQFEALLPEPFAHFLSASPILNWKGAGDNRTVLGDLLGKLRTVPPERLNAPLVVQKGLRLFSENAAAETPDLAHPAPAIEAPGISVPLNSPFYIARDSDRELDDSLSRCESIVLIKGARQMGKTSLLIRGMHRAVERGARVTLTSCQKFAAANLESVDSFYLSLAESLAHQLHLDAFPSDVWDDRRGGNVNFERYLCRFVLADRGTHFVWGLDEVDRLFTTVYGSEVFGLFRSWHNERALEPDSPWSNLTLVLAYATEAHLFITDLNQSPFNVGTRVVLEDFTPGQVQLLNERYGSPLKGPPELERFIDLVNGHPFLVRRALHEMSAKHIPFQQLEEQADLDDGIFGDHLSRMLFLLAKDPKLTEIVRGVVQGKGCPDPESFYRLRSAGVISGVSQAEVEIRCGLYAKFLARHLAKSQKAPN